MDAEQNTYKNKEVIAKDKRWDDDSQFSLMHTQLAMEAAGVGMWDWDLVRDRLVWNTQCKMLFGLAPDEDISYERFLSILHHDDREPIDRVVSRVLEQNEEYKVEYRTIWPDGSLHWIDARGRGIYNAEGKAVRMIGVVLEITEKKRLEEARQVARDAREALRASESRFQSLAESNIIGIVTADLYGAIYDANEAFLQMLGYSPEELAQGLIRWSELTPQEYYGLDAQALNELRTKGVCTPFEKAYIDKHGRHIPVLVGAAMLENSPDQCVAFILDITASKELEKQKDDFISMAGHELRTPLTSIKGNLQLAQRRIKRLKQNCESQAPALTPSVQEIDDFIGRSLRQIEVQNRLINDLLDVTRIDANKLELALQLCDLVEVVRDAVEDLQATTPNRTILLDLPEVPLLVMADPGRIGQVVSNYVTNALKYSYVGQPVIVGAGIEGEQARVWVTDVGPGLPQDVQQHIWERFYQVKGIQVQSGSGVGLGLGLYISFMLITRHDGHVGVESTLGQGSTFWFTLPLAR